MRFLFDNTAPNIDPLSPNNALIFAVGPFASTTIPTSGKYVVQAKSPLTNLMGKSISSGSWGQSLKRAGFDALVIKGKSDFPIYLLIDDELVQFRDARHLWGLSTAETETAIRKEISDDEFSVAVIGPAGENLVKFANITNDKYRQAGRTGMGAVMGSKNLKAVAVRGSNTIEVHDLDALLSKCKDLFKKCQDFSTEVYRKYGTPELVLIHNESTALPTRNWQESTFELAEKISGEYIGKNYVVKTLACSGCPIACDHICQVNEGPFKGEIGSIEFESIYALGSQCGVGYFPAVLKAAILCDQYGMDTISTGVAIGWAMECYEKAIISKSDTGGIDLTFGNYKALLEILGKIAYRQGIGALLAEGTRNAAQKVGNGSEHFAMHNKGLELPGYDLRGLKLSALGFNVSTRGGCHLRSSAYDFDLKGKVDRFKADKGYGKIVKDREDFFTIFDSLILCKFIRSILSSFDELAELYRLTTGIDTTAEMLRNAGERIYNLEKIYNIREGWSRKDDYPPPRIMHDPIPSGVAKGHFVTREEFGLMLDSYYESRGWDMKGFPTKEKITTLGLQDTIKN